MRIIHGPQGSNPWETTTKSGLINIGTHSLHISTSGPPRRRPTQPVLVFLTGGGIPSIFHIRLQRLLSSFIRVYFPDRAGYDASDRSPTSPLTATVNAQELYDQLQTIDVQPPYILVGHSYGCIVAREFLHLCNTKWSEFQQPDDTAEPSKGKTKPIAAMVLVEAATELMYALHSQYSSSSLKAVTRGVDLAVVTRLREESRLTDSEWHRAVAARERTAAGTALEETRLSGSQLAEKHQFQFAALGDAPLSVVRCDFAGDYERVLEEGVRRGNGTEEERREAWEFVRSVGLWDDEVRAGQVRLSSRKGEEEGVRYVYEGGVGHDVVIRKPEVVVREVRFVVGFCEGG